MPVQSPRPRFSIWLPHAVSVGVATAVLAVSAAIAAEPADDEFEEDVPAPLEQVPASVSNVYVWMFGQGYDASLARGQLDTLLRQNIATVDVICRLSDDQKRKLLLAGRGDIKRLIDRIEDAQTRLQRVEQEEAQVDALHAEIKAIKRRLKSEVSTDDSLFDKVLKRILTIEQNSRFATLREIEDVGGKVYADSIGPNAVLDISLSGIPFADEDLARLKVLTGLQGLNLTSTRVTDAGLIHLDGLTNLQSLDLTGTKVTDAGLASLSRLKALQRLELFGTQVTSKGLAHLSSLAGLQELNLSDTPVTDSGLAHVQGLKKLQSLNLHKTQLTDAGLVYLAILTNMEWLDVSATGVSDAGLADLKKLRNLQWVNLSSTQVTDSGLADLKMALPAANIWKRAVRGQD